MKIKIINKPRFALSIIVMLSIIVCLSLFINSSTSLAQSEITYKKMYVSDGDTLWSIAKSQSTNTYYDNKEIRYIVNDISENNNIKSGNLYVGQVLLIPTF